MEIKFETLKEKMDKFKRVYDFSRGHKHGKYKDGIIRPKLRKQIDLDSFKSDYLIMPVSELAKKYGMQQSTVYNWIRREGIQKRGKISNTAKDPETGKFCKSDGFIVPQLSDTQRKSFVKMKTLSTIGCSMNYQVKEKKHDLQRGL